MLKEGYLGRVRRGKGKGGTEITQEAIVELEGASDVRVGNRLARVE